MAARWELWRDDTPDQRIRNAARDLDDSDERQNRHDRYHNTQSKEDAEWRKHVDDEIQGVKKILIGFILSASGLTIAAAINIVVLVIQGK